MLPILLVYLLIVIWNNFIGFDPVVTEISRDQPRLFQDLSVNISMKYSAILYTPDNIFTSSLMTLSTLCKYISIYFLKLTSKNVSYCEIEKKKNNIHVVRV